MEEGEEIDRKERRLIGRKGGEREKGTKAVEDDAMRGIGKRKRKDRSKKKQKKSRKRRRERERVREGGTLPRC